MSETTCSTNLVVTRIFHASPDQVWAAGTLLEISRAHDAPLHTSGSSIIAVYVWDAK